MIRRRRRGSRIHASSDYELALSVERALRHNRRSAHGRARPSWHRELWDAYIRNEPADLETGSSEAA